MKIELRNSGLIVSVIVFLAGLAVIVQVLRVGSIAFFANTDTDTKVISEQPIEVLSQVSERVPSEPGLDAKESEAGQESVVALKGIGGDQATTDIFDLLRDEIEKIDNAADSFGTELDQTSWENILEFQSKLADLIEQGIATPQELTDFIETLPKEYGTITAEVMSSMLPAEILAKEVLDRLPVSTGDGKANLLNLLAHTGTQNPEQRQSIISQLSVMSDPQLVENALHSLTALSVAPIEREQMRTLFSGHLASSDPRVAASAMRMMGNWGFEINQKYLTEGLSHQEPFVRIVTIETALNRGIRNDTIKDHLLVTIADDSLSDRERLAAHDALGDYDLSDAEYVLYHSLLEKVQTSQNESQE